MNESVNAIKYGAGKPPIGPEAAPVPQFQEPKDIGPIRRFFTTAHQLPETTFQGAEKNYPTAIEEIVEGKLVGPIQRIMWEGPWQGHIDTLRMEQWGDDTLRSQIDQAGLPRTSQEFLGWSDAFLRKNIRGKGTAPRYSAEKMGFDVGDAKLPDMTKGEWSATISHAKSNSELMQNQFALARADRQMTSMTQSDIQALLTSSRGSEVDRMSDVAIGHFATWFPPANDVHIDVMGYAMERVSPYYPIRRSFKEEQTLPIGGTAYKRRMRVLLPSMTKSRTGGKRPLIIHDIFSDLERNKKLFSDFIGMTKPLRDAMMLGGNPDFTKALEDNIGKQGTKAGGILDNYFGRFEQDFRQLSAADQIATGLVGKTTKGILAADPTIAAMQELSAFWLPSEGVSLTDVTRMFLDPRKQFVGLDRQIHNEMMQNPFFRRRSEQSAASFTSALPGFGSTRFSITGQQQFTDKALFMAHSRDQWMMRRIWGQAKQELGIPQNQSMLDNPEALERVGKLATKLTYRTQPTGDHLARTEFTAKPDTFHRILSMFSLAKIKIPQIIGRSWSRYVNSDRSAKEKKLLLASIIGLAASQAGLLALREARRWQKRGFKPRKDPKGWRGQLGEFIGSFFGAFYGGNYLQDLIRAGFSNSPERYDPSDPLSGAIKDVALTALYVNQALNQWIDDEQFTSGPRKYEKKYVDSLKKAGLHLSRGLVLVGIPLAAPVSFARGISRAFQKETPPITPLLIQPSGRGGRPGRSGRSRR